MKFLSLIPLTFFVFGCSSKPEPPSAPDPKAPKTELSQKLQNMSPEERAKYVQEHPEEVSGTYSGVAGQNQP